MTEVKTRTLKQNRSIHKYFEMLSQSLNDSGLDIRRTLKQDFEIPWSALAVKELIFKPLLKAHTGKDSTTKMSSKELDVIFMIISKHLSEQFDLTVDFPSIETLMMNDKLKSN